MADSHSDELDHERKVTTVILGKLPRYGNVYQLIRWARTSCQSLATFAPQLPSGANFCTQTRSFCTNSVSPKDLCVSRREKDMSLVEPEERCHRSGSNTERQVSTRRKAHQRERARRLNGFRPPQESVFTTDIAAYRCQQARSSCEMRTDPLPIGSATAPTTSSTEGLSIRKPQPLPIIRRARPFVRSFRTSVQYGSLGV